MPPSETLSTLGVPPPPPNPHSLDTLEVEGAGMSNVCGGGMYFKSAFSMQNKIWTAWALQNEACL